MYPINHGCYWSLSFLKHTLLPFYLLTIYGFHNNLSPTSNPRQQGGDSVCSPYFNHKKGGASRSLKDADDHGIHVRQEGDLFWIRRSFGSEVPRLFDLIPRAWCWSWSTSDSRVLECLGFELSLVRLVSWSLCFCFLSITQQGYRINLTCSFVLIYMYTLTCLYHLWIG